MEKVIIRKGGGYNRLEFCREPDPIPKPHEILIRTQYVGINFADIAVRMGLYSSAKEYIGWPITPGFEFSGTVLAVGSSATKFKVGDSVFGITFFGAYSTHLCVDERYVFKKPEVLDLAQAAGFSTIFFTAYFPLFEMIRLRPGMKVLVHSAAGGVGSALVKLLKMSNCFVVGVVGSGHKVNYVKSLGADAVIEKSSQPLWQHARRICPGESKKQGGYDIILDANGASTLHQSYLHLAPAGKLIIYGFHSMFPKSGGKPNYLKLAVDYLFRTPRFNPLSLTNDNKSIMAFNLSYLFNRYDLVKEGSENLLKWLGERKITPPEVTLFPFHEVAQAHAKLESGQTIGKLVLKT